MTSYISPKTQIKVISLYNKIGQIWCMHRCTLIIADCSLQIALHCADGNLNVECMCKPEKPTHLFVAGLPGGLLSVLRETTAWQHPQPPTNASTSSGNNNNNNQYRNAAIDGTETEMAVANNTDLAAARPQQFFVSQHPLLICPGHGRTGTTSLLAALEQLNLTAEHYTRSTLDLTSLAETGVASQVRKRFAVRSLCMYACLYVFVRGRY